MCLLSFLVTFAAQSGRRRLIGRPTISHSARRIPSLSPLSLSFSSPGRRICIPSVFTTVFLLIQSSPSYMTLVSSPFILFKHIQASFQFCTVSCSFPSIDMDCSKTGMSLVMRVPTTSKLSLCRPSCTSAVAIWIAFIPPVPVFPPRERSLLLRGPLRSWTTYVTLLSS